MNETDISLSLAETLRDAAAARTPLAIQGSGSKAFYTGTMAGAPLSVAVHRGIVAYEPTELVITARAGTPLAQIEATLAEKNQVLGFEPPYFGPGATLGGAIACGFSGPRRPFAGAARDFVLGVKLINGKGEILTFGGQVMKNVAGYDVSRLIAGSLGTLGVILETSLKVMPTPEQEITLAFDAPLERAPATMNSWAGQPLPLSGACYLNGTVYVRLAGSEPAVRAAQTQLGGTAMEHGGHFWRDLNEHRLDFFTGDAPLWRLSVPPATPPLPLPGDWLLDWNGAQRWLKTDALADDIRRAVDTVGGHATRFRGGRRDDMFHPPPPALAGLYQRLKRAFDPAGILNATAFTHIAGEHGR